ncbi:hypothetical protein D3C73_1235500 [compost metagenome]
MTEVEADAVAAAADAAELSGQEGHAFGQRYFEQAHRVKPFRQGDPQEHTALRQRVIAVLPGRTLQELRHQLQPGMVFAVQDGDMLAQIKGGDIQQMMQQPLVQRAGLPVGHLLGRSHHPDQFAAARCPARPQGRRNGLAE